MPPELSSGMIGGQVMDLEAEHVHPDAKTLEYIHRSKTGALLTASVVTGGMYAGANASQLQSLRDFGQNIGLAFQIVDDVLDVTQTSEQLGKTAGKDTATEKATYPALFGVDASLKKADELSRRSRRRAGSVRRARRIPCARSRTFWWRGRNRRSRGSFSLQLTSCNILGISCRSHRDKGSFCARGEWQAVSPFHLH